jgi:aryl carrier-like protein
VDEKILTPATLRRYLNGRLPRYMVPQAFVLLEKFPLTTNGKLDRRALPACENMQPTRNFMTPRTGTEKALAAIWSELLNKENIGVDDDFFDLGGHSLLAIKLVSRMRDVFESDLQLRNLFEHPTVAGLAEVIDGLSWMRQTGDTTLAADDREEIVL